MKPFVWITALVIALVFLAGAAFTGFEALNEADWLTGTKSKVAAGWSLTGLIFLSLGYRGWKSWRRRLRAANSSRTT